MSGPAQAAAVVVAAGSGQRLGGERPKALVCLGGIPLVRHSVSSLASCPAVERLVLVAPPGAAGEEIAREAGLPSGALVVQGGARRRDSVLAGVQAAAGLPFVLVHDAARPFVSRQLVDRVLAAAERCGAAVPVLPLADALIREEGGRVAAAVARETLRAVQTPQGFSRELLLRAHHAAPAGWDAPDDGSMIRRLGEEVAVVPGSAENIKITWPGDLERAAAWLEHAREGGATVIPRIGLGWDVHPLAGDRPFRLAGVELTAAFGPVGHSDGDPLAHAVADALLGAAALGDIGQLFPDTDPAFRGLAGEELLRRVVEVLAGAGLRPGQVDAVLITDQPKIAPHREEVRRALAAILGLPADRVFLKGKRTEGLGGLAGGAGVACHALAQVVPR